MRRATLPRLVLTLLALSALAAGCKQPSPSKEPIEPTPEPRAVVLSLEEAPAWAKAGTTIEVRDENDEVLLEKPLTSPPPVLLDLTVPPSVHQLAVAVRASGHEAKAQARIEGGYASCKLH